MLWTNNGMSVGTLSFVVGILYTNHPDHLYIDFVHAIKLYISCCGKRKTHTIANYYSYSYYIIIII